MPGQNLLRKLLIKPGQRLLVLNAPREYLRWLEENAQDVCILTEIVGEFDFAHIFVENSEELDINIHKVKEALKFDGCLWISYPKQSRKYTSELSRDQLWKLMQPYGLAPVAQVSVNDIWTAMRFRPIEMISR